MTREILIANTKTQKKSKLNSEATTLGELKNEMDAAGIDYAGMTFTEGITKTQLINDDSQLPQNVMYHGQTTNNLVILLTNTKKNIASGAMSRKEAYQVIKDNELQDAIKEEFGRNFTQVPTSDLEVFINNNTDPSEDEEEVEIEDIDSNDYEEVENDSTEEEKHCDIEDLIIDTRITSVIDSLFVHIATIVRDGAVSIDEVKKLKESLDLIIGCMQQSKSEPICSSDGSITNEDIDDMINSL